MPEERISFADEPLVKPRQRATVVYDPTRRWYWDGHEFQAELGGLRRGGVTYYTEDEIKENEAYMAEINRDETLRKLEEDRRQLQTDLREQRDIVRTLYAIIVRGMVVLKYLLRAGAVGAAYFWLSPKEAYLLAGFILVVGLLQLVIDKTRKVVHPDLKLSEWDIL